MLSLIAQNDLNRSCALTWVTIMKSDPANDNGSLTVQLCQQNADACRDLLLHTNLARARVMLEHIAGTWERIAASLKEMN
jgi:hypothetical protein